MTYNPYIIGLFFIPYIKQPTRGPKKHCSNVVEYTIHASHRTIGLLVFCVEKNALSAGTQNRHTFGMNPRFGRAEHCTCFFLGGRYGTSQQKSRIIHPILPKKENLDLLLWCLEKVNHILPNAVICWFDGDFPWLKHITLNYTEEKTRFQCIIWQKNRCCPEVGTPLKSRNKNPQQNL